jgi:hypothetical protein
MIQNYTSTWFDHSCEASCPTPVTDWVRSSRVILYMGAGFTKLFLITNMDRYGSIYLMDGRSLREAAQSLASQHKVKTAGGTLSIAENVDFCHECGDGGELVLCDGCPAAYHQDCLGLDSVPAGDWYCQDCQLQQSAATGNGHRVVGKQRLKRRTKTLLTKDRITGRCTRLLQVPETVILGGCVFCK